MNVSKLQRAAVIAVLASAFALSSGAALPHEAVLAGVAVGVNPGAGSVPALSLDGVLSSSGRLASGATQARLSLASSAADGFALAGWTRIDLESRELGCAPAGSDKGCVTRSVAVVDPEAFSFAYTGTPSLDAFSDEAPVHEHETYALVLAGLGVAGFVSRRRRQA